MPHSLPACLRGPMQCNASVHQDQWQTHKAIVSPQRCVTRLCTTALPPEAWSKQGRRVQFLLYCSIVQSHCAFTVPKMHGSDETRSTATRPVYSSHKTLTRDSKTQHTLTPRQRKSRVFPRSQRKDSSFRVYGMHLIYDDIALSKMRAHNRVFQRERNSSHIKQPSRPLHVRFQSENLPCRHAR